MHIRTVINKQNLTPKEKAKLCYWQYSEGTYPKHSPYGTDLGVVKSSNDLSHLTDQKSRLTAQELGEGYCPVFTTAEFERLMYCKTSQEQREVNAWRHIIMMINVIDMQAQIMYQKMIGHLTMVTSSMLYVDMSNQIYTPKTNSKHTIQKKDLCNHLAPSFGLSFLTTIPTITERMQYCAQNFFALTRAALLANYMMDELDTNLPCLSLLTSFPTQEQLLRYVALDYLLHDRPDLATYVQQIQGMGKHVYEEHTAQIMADSLYQFHTLIKPLESFNVSISPISVQRYSEAVDMIFQRSLGCGDVKK
jgi:hypothetical protein